MASVPLISINSGYAGTGHDPWMNAKMRTMQRAVETLGGEKALAEILQVTREDVARWLSGAASPQDAAYLAALDIVARGPMGSSRTRPK
jgi:hypothetical protein